MVLVMALALVQVGLLVRDRLLVESAARAGARGLYPPTACIRLACTMKLTITNAAPATTHGQGFRYWSQPDAVAVCQQTVPGPRRCT